MVSLIGLALFGILFLMLLAIVGNAGEDSITRIENQIFLMNCPFPINGGIANNTNIEGLTVTYDLIRDNSTNDFHLTLFDCQIIDPDIPTYGASTTVLTTANNWFNVGIANLSYVSNFIYSGAQKVQAFLNILSFVLTPANFSIFGYTLDDLSGIPLMLIVGTYVICYVFIGAWIYTTLNPFKGGG